MRSSLTLLTTKFVSIFCAATLALGLVPAAAFAANDPVEDESSQAIISNEAAETDAAENSDAAASSADAGLAPRDGEAETEDNAQASGDDNLALSIPAATERVDQDVALTTPVAQAESVRNYFLAQTLESTKTVPMVSADLPLDTAAVDNESDGADGDNATEDEGGEDSDESDPAPGVIAAASTVIGSFTYEGMTFAIEPGGESVALMAVDYDQLPESFIEMQIIVIPEAVTSNGYDYYSVTRIADDAFASLTKENADPEFVGCEALFADEDLLAEAGIEPTEAEAFLDPESDVIDVDGDGEMDGPANPLKNCTGILVLGIPSSVTSIADDTFAGFDTLQYIVVFEDNPNYASYDGALYSASLDQLRLIPEGRVGAVRVAPSATDVDPEAFSHCASVTTLVADPEDHDIFVSNLIEFVNLWDYREDNSPAMLSDMPALTRSTARAQGVYTQWKISRGGSSFENQGGCSDAWFYQYKDGNQIWCQTGHSFRNGNPTNNGSQRFNAPGYLSGSTAWLYSYDQVNWYLVPLTVSEVVAETVYLKPTKDMDPFSSHIVTLDNQGATTAGTTSVTAYYGSPFSSAITIPVKTGYTFGGYFTSTDGGGTQYFDSNGQPTANTWNTAAAGTLYAAWTINTYTVTWYANYTGANPASATTSVSYGSTTTASAAKFSRTGYTIDGWSTDSGYTAGKIGANGTTATITGNIGYYAHWKANTYTVTWYANYTGANPASATTSVEYGSTTTASATKFSRTGYTIDGWSTDSGYTAGKIDANGTTATITGNTTYYAHWKANTYTVTWNANYGTSPATSTTSVEYGKTTTASATKFSRTGYTIDGWSTDSGYTAGKIGANGTTATITGNTTYYAHWKANTYTVTWYANYTGANPASATTSVDYGSTTTASATKFSRTGYTIDGWSTDSGYTAGKIDANGTTATITGNTSYYAHWKANTYTVTWNANYGTSPATSTTSVEYGKTTTASATKFSRTGYTIDGWYTNAACTTGGIGAADTTATITGNTTYYAHWKGNTITVTWNGNGGSWGNDKTASTSKQYAENQTIPMIADDPTREGYSFKGWVDSNNNAVTASTALPTSNPIYTAQWDINSYTITWKSDGWNSNETETVDYASIIDWRDPGTKPAHVFVGWQASGVKDNARYSLDAQGNLPVALMKAGDVTLTAVWEAAYKVDFTAENLAYIRSIKMSDGKTGATSLLLKDADLAAGTTVTGVNVNTDYYNVDYGFDKFVVRGIDLSSVGWTYSNGESWTRSPFTFNESTIATYFPGQNDMLIINAVFHNEDYTVPGIGEVDPLTHWEATLDLAGGELSASAKTAWQGNPPSVDFTHCSKAITLPSPTKFGYDFKGWSGSYDDAAHKSETPNCIVIAPGSIWDRTYTANWTPKTTTIKFSYNAEGPANGYVGVPDPVSVTYGKAMPKLNAQVPTREGYRFIGFFDTDASSGGRLYYTSDLASARSWDKNFGAGDTCTLYARWTAEADSSHTHRVTADPASGLMMSTPHEGAKGYGTDITVFDADYKGVYAWESYDAKASKPAASGTVVIDVSAYDFKSSFNIKKIPALFDYDNPNPDGPRYRLLGFKIGSGENATFVKFTQLLDGDHFRVTLHGYEMDLQGTTPADFKLPALTVEPVYTDGYPGYDLDPEPDGDDDPENGDRITTVFDANGGTFSNGSSIETTVTVYPASVVEPTTEPTRTGYEFLGWSLSASHESGCDCDDPLPAITSKAPRTFYAHWEAKTIQVVYQEVDGKNHVGQAVFGELLPALGTNGGAPKPEAREGYVFMGYFDSATAAGSLQYIDASGKPVRVWNIDASPTTLYAQWARDTTGADPIDPTPPDPSNPDPSEPPFPGDEDPWKSVPTDEDDDAKSYVKMPVSGNAVSEVLYDGIFEGVMRFTDSTDADKPAAATDNVELTIYSYDPDDGTSAHESFEAVRRAFEANAPADTPYLQGFKVVSTGWPISILDLHEGRTIVVQCMGADLDWDATYEGNAISPASAVFKSGKVVAVYSATPVIDPGIDWPNETDPTQVFNSFDAYCGRFPVSATDSTLTTERVRTVASDYKGELNLPIAPRYDVEGHEFDGWYLDGKKVDENTIVTWAPGKTIYAHYKQVFFRISFAHDTDASQTFDDMTEVWKGQDPANLRAEFQKRVPTRAGYEFVGWAYYPNGLADEDAAVPYYLVGPASDWTGATPAKAVTSDVTLHPLWSERTYTITWNYVYGRFQFHSEQPYVQWTKVRYGEEFAELPAPTDPRYGFLGWYPSQIAAGSATTDAGDTAIVGADKWFTKTDSGTYAFAPANAVDTTNQVSFYAGWDTAKPVSYTVTLNAGIGPDPTFGAAGTHETTKTVDASYKENGSPIDVYASDCIPYPNLAGWKFAGWVDEDGAPFVKGTLIPLGHGSRELTATWEIEKQGAYSITFLRGDEVSATGPDGVDWYLYGSSEYLALDEVTERFDASTGSVAVPRFSPASTVGYDFAGWQRVEKDKDGKWQEATNASFDKIAAATEAFTGQELVQFASAENTSSLVFRAIWEPKKFDILYFMEEGVDSNGEAIFQPMDMSGVDAKDSASVSYDAKVTLPEPAFQNIGAIFERWGAKDSVTSAGTALLPGKQSTVRDIVEAVGPQAVSVENGKNVLSLYGMTTPGMSFTVPLNVTIAFDPERPEESMIAGAATIETTQTKPVEVKSVELLRYGTDSTLEVQGRTDGPERVNLLIQAHRAADGTDLDATKYLSMNLGARNEHARYGTTALAGYGFGTFMNGNPLLLDYRLALDLPTDGSLTGNSYAKLLGLRDMKNADDTRMSLPVAKLFYTVGLAPSALTGTTN